MVAGEAGVAGMLSREPKNTTRIAASLKPYGNISKQERTKVMDAGRTPSKALKNKETAGGGFGIDAELVFGWLSLCTAGRCMSTPGFARCTPAISPHRSGTGVS